MQQRIMNDEKRMKMAVIAGASHALKEKERNPRATDAEIIQSVIKEVNFILDKIDEEN